jgi:coenzyme F420-reducing hydrogenase delta subunit/Pyruvate/2-oxoacid:ferredoxin oxidoreductase delta subunit
LLRAPGTLALALDAAHPAHAWLLPRIAPATLMDIDVSRMVTAQLLPVRARIHDERCRGCARCVEVCPFGAARLVDGDGLEPSARIEAALCRGCNLCTAVCPTKAAVASALSPQWWGSRLEDAFHAAAPTRPHVVLACQRRAGGIEAVLDRPGIHVEIIRFRCVGQVDAGMLLELTRLGARGVLVAGCAAERCRFGSGARLAREQVERAQQVLRLLGVEPTRITCDWAAGRAEDPLAAGVGRLVAVEPRPGEASPAAV